VYLCQRLHIQLYSWWWVQEAPETCRVVKKCSNKGHCPAASCWFIWYWYTVYLHENAECSFTMARDHCLPAWAIWSDAYIHSTNKWPYRDRVALNCKVLFQVHLCISPLLINLGVATQIRFAKLFWVGHETISQIYL